MKEIVSYAGEIVLSYRKLRKRTGLGQMTSPETYFDFAKKIWPEDLAIRERGLAIFLDTSLQVLGHFWTGAGAIGGTVVDIRIVSHISLRLLATGVVFIHNHPTGNLQSSQQDIKLVKELRNSLAVIDVKLIDAIILGHDTFWSIQAEKPELFYPNWK